jgi:ubiquinone/menaquinone biosynthesis C-methylase UbiE
VLPAYVKKQLRVGDETNMMDPAAQYALGNTDAEHERLTRQAAQFDPLTERLFREAGIGPGQRVVELGSGAGDVAMLVARIVGPSGEVVGVERNEDSIAYATTRVAKAGLNNVRFTQTDVGQIEESEKFDAAVGRFILQFVPDPVAVVRSLKHLVRPGGAIAFQEVYWDVVLRLAAQLPLNFATRSLVHATIRQTGANTDMGPALREVFQAAELPTPAMYLDMPLGNEHKYATLLLATLESLRPRIDASDPRLKHLGDIDTLAKRLVDEIAAEKNAAVPWLAAVGAWTRIPL